MSAKSIHLGFEVGSGEPIGIPPSHIIVTGVTQLSGKTTTLEALIKRSGLKAIVFKTKPGERGFNEGIPCPPYFKEKADWQYVSSLLEATLKEKLKFERSWIMTACKGAASLLDVKRNIEQQLANPKLRDLHRSVYTTLDEYFNLILPQLSVISFSRTLEVQEGVNIMDLERMKDELQSLMIRSVLETVLHEMHDTIVVIPEAWKFLPQERGNPCKQSAEEFIRQGATNKNYLWIDSQDIAGVDKTPLKSVTTWILGLQSERNEVRHTLDQMPIPKKLRPAEDQIMTLPKGHFYVCTPAFSKKVYVQPAWLDEAAAIEVAAGKKDVAEVVKPISAMLPPLPRPVAVEATDEKLLMLETLDKKINDTRRDFLKHIDELTSYVTKVAQTVTDLAMRPAVSSSMAAPTLTPDQVKSLLPNFELMKQEIIDAVLAKIPKGGAAGGTTTVVEPLKALQNKFLEETKQRLLTTIDGLTADAKKILQFVESVQRGVSQKDLCDKCLGIKGDSGGNQAKVRDISKMLFALNLARRDDRNAMTYPALREKIKAELGFHQATDGEIDQLYAHIIAELL